jgi:hypothetical protein
MIDFLGEVCATIKRIDKDVSTTVVVLPHDLGQIEDLAQLAALDTVGCHLFWNALREDIGKVRAWGSEVVAVMRTHRKRSQLWLQNFSLDEEAERELETAFYNMLAVEPDEVGCYYYWRNNANPGRVWEMTRSMLRRVPRRQLRWRIIQPEPKEEKQVS